MKINFPNGIIAEGTVDECEMLLSDQKKKVEDAITARKSVSHGRTPWTGRELSIILSTIDLPIAQALKLLPGRGVSSVRCVRGAMRKKKMGPSLRKKLNTYLSNQRTREQSN